MEEEKLKVDVRRKKNVHRSTEKRTEQFRSICIEVYRCSASMTVRYRKFYEVVAISAVSNVFISSWWTLFRFFVVLLRFTTFSPPLTLLIDVDCQKKSIRTIRLIFRSMKIIEKSLIDFSNETRRTNSIKNAEFSSTEVQSNVQTVGFTIDRSSV